MAGIFDGLFGFSQGGGLLGGMPQQPITIDPNMFAARASGNYGGGLLGGLRGMLDQIGDPHGEGRQRALDNYLKFRQLQLNEQADNDFLKGFGGGTLGIPGLPARPSITPQAGVPSIGGGIVNAETSPATRFAKNPNSSATGPGQFIDSTWLETVKRYRPDVAAALDDKTILSMRSDPALEGFSREMTEAYATQNRQTLANAGLPTTPGATYLAHFAGPAGATKILSANPETPVSALLSPQAIQANPFLQNMTAGQLRQWADSKMGGTQSAQVDPAALPPTATPTQGFAAQQSGMGPDPQNLRNLPMPDLFRWLSNRNLSPQYREIVKKLFDAKVDDMKITDKQKDYLKAQGDKAYANFVNPPTFGAIGKDEFGSEIQGWRNANDQTVTPAQPQTGPAKPPIELTSKLRKEVQDLPSYKNIAQAAPVYKSMLEGAGRDNRAADVNMIYGFAKIMDPSSVVRESEMTIAQAVATLPQHIQSTVMSQMTATGRLSPEVRAAIMQEAHSRMMAYKGMFDQDTKMYRGIATRQRMNLDDVLPDFGEFPKFEAPQRTLPPDAVQEELRRRGAIK